MLLFAALLDFQCHAGDKNFRMEFIVDRFDAKKHDANVFDMPAS